MPIKLPSTLPAYSILANEGVMVIDDELAAYQDIRPLKIGLLNLMPKKIQTETQFARLIGATPLQIELTLIKMSDHTTRNTTAEHMESFYQPFSDICERKFDGLIITGAPIEHLDFKSVSYWDELIQIMNWTQTNVHSTFGVCWGGMAMLHHFHSVPKHLLDHKLFGAYRHTNLAPASKYLRGFSDECVVPVSRWTEVRHDEVKFAGLQILLGSELTGPCLIEDSEHRALYILNHFEYDSNTLKEEYERDLANNQIDGAGVNLPFSYFPYDDPTQAPLNLWRSHAHLLYGNWLSEIYLSTPYNIDLIGEKRTDLRD